MSPLDRIMIVSILLGVAYVVYYVYLTVTGAIDILTKTAKKTKVLSPSPLSDCGPGKEMDAGLCYEKCRDGHKPGGPMCHVDIHGVGIGRIPPG